MEFSIFRVSLLSAPLFPLSLSLLNSLSLPACLDFPKRITLQTKTIIRTSRRQGAAVGDYGDHHSSHPSLLLYICLFLLSHFVLTRTYHSANQNNYPCE